LLNPLFIELCDSMRLRGPCTPKKTPIRGLGSARGTRGLSENQVCNATGETAFPRFNDIDDPNQMRIATPYSAAFELNMPRPQFTARSGESALRHDFASAQ
jgi:hypothetical protein